MFQKILIIGCPGAGKSTFARRLSSKTGYPLYYLDMLWHKPDKTVIEKSIFISKLQEIIKTDTWIIDGNYSSTLEMRIKACDTIFLLDFPVSICLEGAMSRIGKDRVDMPWIESELDLEFKEWIINFPKNELPFVYELLEKYKNDKNIYIFHDRKDIDDYINKLI